MADNKKTYFTYGMIKPDGMEHREEIYDMIRAAGLQTPFIKEDILTEDLIDENYPHCIGKDFYEGMKANLLSGPVKKMLIYDKEGDAVNKYRKVLGATKSSEAAPDTIRGMFGNKEITYKNAAHGSGNSKEAIDEIFRFFKDDMQELLLFIRITGECALANNLSSFIDDQFLRAHFEKVKR